MFVIKDAYFYIRLLKIRNLFSSVTYKNEKKKRKRSVVIYYS